jgi:hypothetical protein
MTETRKIAAILAADVVGFILAIRVNMAAAQKQSFGWRRKQHL